MTKLESYLLVKELNARLFQNAILEQQLLIAISTPAAYTEVNYERLEFLGELQVVRHPFRDADGPRLCLSRRLVPEGRRVQLLLRDHARERCRRAPQRAAVLDREPSPPGGSHARRGAIVHPAQTLRGQVMAASHEHIQPRRPADEERGCRRGRRDEDRLRREEGQRQEKQEATAAR